MGAVAIKLLIQTGSQSEGVITHPPTLGGSCFSKPFNYSLITFSVCGMV